MVEHLIPNPHIVGGFSLGGHYSLHVAYRTHPQIAGIFTMAPFLNNDSVIYEILAARQQSSVTTADLPQLLCIHGYDDDLILHEYGVHSFRELTRLGVRGEFHTMRGAKHDIQMWHLLKVEKWARELLPALADDLVHKM